MLLSLLTTAFMMGVIGGPHCLAMCAAPCTLFTGSVSKANEVRASGYVSNHGRSVSFHVGRWVGYSAIGASVAFIGGLMAWFAGQAPWMRLLWVAVHVMSLLLGLCLLLQAQQPRWLEQFSRALWIGIHHRLGSKFHSFLAGACWAFMPCSLLYSALSIAALSGDWIYGVFIMLMFAVGTTVWLLSGAYVLRIAGAIHCFKTKQQFGMRLAGGILSAFAIYALWHDFVNEPARWCQI